VTLVAATERGWTDPLTESLAHRLVEDFASYSASPGVLARVAAAARSGARWPVAARAYEKLAARYGDAPAGRRARVELAETFVQAGALPQARDAFRRAALAGGEESGRAWLRLAEISQLLGDRREALEAYERVPRTMPRPADSVMAHARLLQDAGRADRAQSLLQSVAQGSSGDIASEAAYDLGRLASARAQHTTALEWFGKALGAAPESRWGRLALLGIGDSLTALGRKPEALTTYNKIVAAAPVDAWRGADTHAAERELAGEAAYRGGELLRTAGRHGEALNMFMTSALFTRGSAAERRALLRAVQCSAAAGDRSGAEAIYRQLQAAAADASMLAEARRVLEAEPGASALPRDSR